MCECLYVCLLKAQGISKACTPDLRNLLALSLPFILYSLLAVVVFDVVVVSSAYERGNLLTCTQSRSSHWPIPSAALPTSLSLRCSALAARATVRMSDGWIHINWQFIYTNAIITNACNARLATGLNQTHAHTHPLTHTHTPTHTLSHTRTHKLSLASVLYEKLTVIYAIMLTKYLLGHKTDWLRHIWAQPASVAAALNAAHIKNTLDPWP